jgi:MFS family permease
MNLTSEPEPPPHVQKSLSLAVKDGVAWAMMHAWGERYIGPFVIRGTDVGFYGLAALAALPVLMGAFIMWYAAHVIDRAGRRKSYMVNSVYAQAVVWLVAAAAVWAPIEVRYWLMLLVFVLYLGLQNFTAPIWISIMTDLVPEHRRGRYFGMRNFVVGIAVWAAMYLAGTWLVWNRGIETLGTEFYGYAVLFAGAFLFRALSGWYLGGIHEADYRPKEEEIFSLREFIRRIPAGNFGRFCVYQLLLYAGTGIAAAFFTWYWLSPEPGGLGLNVQDYALLTIFQMVTLFGAQPIVGRLADRFGNKKMIAVGGIGIGLIPALWLVSRDFTYICFVQVYDGLVWAAFSLASFNYIFDCVTPAKRARCTAFLTLFVGAGNAVGCFFGAWLAEMIEYPVAILGVTVAHPFTMMLIVSTAGRLLPNLLLGSFKEMRLKSGELVA